MWQISYPLPMGLVRVIISIQKIIIYTKKFNQYNYIMGQIECENMYRIGPRLEVRGWRSERAKSGEVYSRLEGGGRRRTKTEVFTSLYECPRL